MNGNCASVACVWEFPYVTAIALNAMNWETEAKQALTSTRIFLYLILGDQSTAGNGVSSSREPSAVDYAAQRDTRVAFECIWPQVKWLLLFCTMYVVYVRMRRCLLRFRMHWPHWHVVQLIYD